MQNNPITKSAVLMLVTVLTAVTCYEISLRNSGVEIAYDDGPALWSDKRAQVYEPAEKQVVFIGSSRIKFDLDIPTWENQTGLKAVQLACVGSTPLPLLADLANDPDFKGKLVIDVTEPLFFSDLPPYKEKPGKAIAYFHDRTLAQQASFELNEILESQFVFLDKDYFSLNAQLDALELTNRPGVFAMPIFPFGFERTEFDRQTYMTDDFVKDPMRVNAMRGIWGQLMGGPHPPPMTYKQIHAMLLSVKASTDKIKSRGGNVIFVRTPSSGAFLQGEAMGFPKDKYWNKILEVTGCAGIHFQDFPETAHFQCPEFSHLSRPDARLYTKRLIAILSQYEGWQMKAPEKLLTQTLK